MRLLFKTLLVISLVIMVASLMSIFVLNENDDYILITSMVSTTTTIISSILWVKSLK